MFLACHVVSLSADGVRGAEFWDAKFCPYQPLNQDPVFAAISMKHIVICKVSSHAGDVNPCQVISVIRDEDVSRLPEG